MRALRILIALGAQAVKMGIPIVSEKYLFDRLKAGTEIDHTPYLMEVVLPQTFFRVLRRFSLALRMRRRAWEGDYVRTCCFFPCRRAGEFSPGICWE